MHRCYVEPAEWNDSAMFLSPDEEHHLLDVMRVGVGEKVAVFDGKGREAVAEVAARECSGKHRVVLKVLEIERKVRPAVAITLIQALPKGKIMDAIVDKATELGVFSISPVITERTVVRLDKKQRIERAERWQRIALSASRQCRTKWTPDVKPVVDFADAMKSETRHDLLLVGVLGPEATPLHETLNEAKKKFGCGEHSRACCPNQRTDCEAGLRHSASSRHAAVPPVHGRNYRGNSGGSAASPTGFDIDGASGNTPSASDIRHRTDKLLARGHERTYSIGLVIGPEGDLTRKEIEQVIDIGGRAVGFGSLVLRVETAAVYALSVLAYEFLDLRSQI